MLSVVGLRAAYIRGANILQGLNFSLETGELVAVIGRNGMGKTTLVRSLMGMTPHIEGSVKFMGEEMVGRKNYEISNRGIAYVPQGREIFNEFTVEENLWLGVLGQGQSEPDFDYVYRHFPILAERKRQAAGTMSGGQQQQLAIARALISKPKLLLLDEPSEGIQPNLVHEIAVALKKISAEERLTVLLIEQNMELVSMLSERVDFIENGLIAQSVGVGVLRDDPGLVERYMSV